MKKNILYIGMASLLMIGCDKNEAYEMPTIDDGELRIEAQHPSATRATETAFEKGISLAYLRRSIPMGRLLPCKSQVTGQTM